MAIVGDNDGVYAVECSPIDGDNHRLRFRIECVPNQLFNPGERAGRARKAIELVRVDLDDEALSHG
jgi:hypothetical protein